MIPILQKRKQVKGGDLPMITLLASGRARTHTHIPLTPDSGYQTTSLLWSTPKRVFITHKEANGLISRNPVSGLLQ